MRALTEEEKAQRDIEEYRRVMKKTEGIVLGATAALIIIGLIVGVIMLGDGMMNDINI